MRTATLLLIALVIGSGSAVADEKAKKKPAKPLTTEQAADAVFKAVEANDQTALKALAEKDKPDPWLVADLLCYRREHDAAEAFAKAAPRKAVEMLPAYVTSQRTKEPDQGARTALGKVQAALRSRDPAGALRAAAGFEVASQSMTRIRIVSGRGQALMMLRQFPQSAEAHRNAAQAAQRLGWLVGAGNARHSEGLARHRASDLQQARSALEAALEVYTMLGVRDGIASALGVLGSVCESRAEYPQALSFYTRALEVYEALGSRLNIAVILGNMGLIQYRIGGYAKALDLHTRALGILQALGDRMRIAMALGNIGMVHESLGDYPQALGTYQRVLATFESLGHRGHAAKARAQIGTVHFCLGEYPEALRSLMRALEVYEALGNRGAIAMVLGKLGNVHLGLGEYPKALVFYARAHTVFKTLGARAFAAGSLLNMGMAHEYLGAYPKALEFFDRARSEFEAIGERGGCAKALGEIGGMHWRLGDYRKALEFYMRALALEEALGNRIGIAAALGNVGSIHKELGEYVKAREYHARSLAMSEAIGDRAGIASSLMNIAGVPGDLDDLDDRRKALEVYARALEAFEGLGNRHGIAMTHRNIGSSHADLGDLPKALQSYERALATLEGVGASATRARTLSGIAAVHLAGRDYGEAIRSARDAVEAISKLGAGLGEQEGATARDLWTEPFEVGACAALHVGSHEDLLYFLESGRAGGLREALGARQALSEALIPADLRTAEASARAREANALAQYDRARSSGKMQAVRTARTALTQARNGLEEAVQRIQRKVKGGADVAYPKASSLASIQGWLRPHEALVVLGSVGEEVVAVVATAGSVEAHMLGPVARIEAQVEALRPWREGEDPSTAVKALRARVVAPLGLASTTKRVLISPHGALSYIPFVLLLPEREVVYVPSGTTYVLLTEERNKRGNAVLALGDPDYGVSFEPKTVAVVRGGRGLQPLPATRHEARAIGDRVLLGREATEGGLARIAKEQERWRAVHLACHGLIDTERPMFSTLVLTPDETSDGFLTCLEVFRMHMPADLVVLSACETATGRIYRAEGIVGLTRAFMFAGAPRVICSLWKVDDEATQALMIKFYELWNPKGGKKGLGAAAALKEAQAYVRDFRDKSGKQIWKHPYYWAAWVLWGLPD